MTGDRPLKDHEKRLFISDHSLDALANIRDAMFKGGEPTLHDVAIIELLGRGEALTNLIVQQGRKIQALETQLDELIDLIKGFQKLVEGR